MNEPVVQLQNLCKTIKGKKIIEGIDLELYRGEVFGFLGPNGAGKTTTIRMMVGLMKPTSGQVTIHGIVLHKHYEQAMKKVGAIVENPELYSYMTGYKNLLHFSRMHEGVSKERIQEVVEQVGLTSRIQEKVKTYSLGMRQRLGLAQALLHKPDFLILDEPTNGLDPAGIREFRIYLRRIAKEEGVSIFVSSHLLAEVELMCDRVGIIQKGKLIDVRNVHAQSTSKTWMFTVDDPMRAKKLFGETVDVEEMVIQGHTLSLPLDREEVPSYNQLLVEYGVQVYGIQLMTPSLEEEFLKVTGGEQVDSFLTSRSK